MSLHGHYQSWAYCAEERKSASFFFAPQCKLRFSKAQSLKILDATLIATFTIGFSMVNFIQTGSYSVVDKSRAFRVRISPRCEFAILYRIILIKLQLHFKLLFVKTCFLSINCCGAMRFKQFKSAIAFCVLRSCFTNYVLLLRRNIFNVARPTTVTTLNTVYTLFFAKHTYFDEFTPPGARLWF